MAGEKGPLRLALAQLNPIVGEINGNCQRAFDAIASAWRDGVHLIALPEMMVTGYPVEDLALRGDFRMASRRAVDALAHQLASAGMGNIVVVIGYLDQNDNQSSHARLGMPVGAPENALAVIHQGKIIAKYVKRHLPNYGVFDEFRNFVPGSGTLVIRLHGIDIALAICEDIWQDGGVMPEIASRNPGLLLVINGSPYESDKDDSRSALISRRAREIASPVAYVNMVGGQDELVFDGDSLIANSQGEILARAPQFNEGTMVVDIQGKLRTSAPDVVISEGELADYPSILPKVAPALDRGGELWSALVTGLRDYVAKGGFPSVLIGLSGGIDSALVAALAVDALGPERVYGVGMPSKYSSSHSLTDAADLAARTRLNYRVVEIEPMVSAYLMKLGFTGVAEENLQARVRGTTLMGISNQEGHLVLATGNKSELAVGYSTIYGDAVGGYAPIKDLWKSAVWELARWRNHLALSRGEVPPIPESSINKEPSAELRPGQRDTDSLPDYPLLDRILHRYVTLDQGFAEIVAAGFDAALVGRVMKMVDRAEYKRRQYPPGTKVSARNFGKDRRLPIISKWVP
jgi:NAD+ synthase (glutamine-hydrolysing)